MIKQRTIPNIKPIPLRRAIVLSDVSPKYTNSWVYWKIWGKIYKNDQNITSDEDSSYANLNIFTLNADIKINSTNDKIENNDINMIENLFISINSKLNPLASYNLTKNKTREPTKPSPPNNIIILLFFSLKKILNARINPNKKNNEAKLPVTAIKYFKITIPP